MRAHAIFPDTDSLTSDAPTAPTGLPTSAQRIPTIRRLSLSRVFILHTPSAHLPAKGATSHSSAPFIPELTKKSRDCLTLRHFFHMHLLHSSIAYPGYCADAETSYFKLNKGETNRVA
jgi:hypothetical protein